MNSLVVFENEGWDERRVTIEGERAHEAYQTGEYEVGAEIRVVVFGGEKGIGRVVECARDRLVFDVIRTESSLALRPVDLIVGLARPQTTKKVLQAAVMSGVRSLHLVHLASGEKSYLDAHLLRDGALREEIAKSLAQIWEGLYPKIHIHRSFHRFVRDHQELLQGASTAMRIVAQPGGVPLDHVRDVAHDAAVIAVGSEGGWSDEELHAFTAAGFSRVGLGERVVRVEVALLYLLGQTLSLAK